MGTLGDILGSTGAERRAWLDRQEAKAANALRYYIGPHGFQSVQNLARLLEFSDANDYQDYQKFGERTLGALTRGDYWQAAQDAAQSGAAGLATAIPAVSARALRGAGESAAEGVARLLREGRSGEITDDMMAGLSPQDHADLKRLYEDGATGADMPMDEASRMARAREMGFRTEMPLHHGTAADFAAFDPMAGGRTTGNSAARSAAAWLSVEPEVADEFAGLAARDSDRTGQSVIPVLHRADRAAAADLDGTETNEEIAATLNEAFSNGLEGVMFRNYTTPGGAPEKKIVAVKDAEQLRARSARFDPRLRHLRNLTASIPLGAILAADAAHDKDADGNPAPPMAY